MVVCEGYLHFTIDVKGGEDAVGRGVMIARGVLVLPLMPKGEIVDQQLRLMSTQEAPRATPILHGNIDLKKFYIMGQELFLWFLLVKMFPLIYHMPRNSSWFERY